MTETEVRQFMEEYFHAALVEPGVDAYLDLLTPDASLEDPVGTPPHRGREAIGKFLATGRTLIERTEISIREIFVCGDECAVRWSVGVWSKTGKHAVIEGAGFFVFAEPRKLRQIREFYDAARLQEIFS